MDSTNRDSNGNAAGLQNSNLIVLELTDELRQQEIITSFVYDKKNKLLILSLNHKYNKKTIPSPVFENSWQKTVKTFVQQAEQKGVDKDHVNQICDAVDNNWETILDHLVDTGQNGNGKGTRKEKREFVTYKYSNMKKGDLHEAVILSGRPVFLKYDNMGAEPIKLVEVIEENTRVLRPPSPENYPYAAYEFENMNEVFSYLERARSETIDSLYEKSKKIVTDYNDHSKHKLNLLAIDII